MSRVNFQFNISLIALILFISTSIIADNQNQQGGFVTVGFSNDCNFRTGDTKIQDAINSGAAEIRVAVGTYIENIALNNKDAIIKGGYSSCGAARDNNQDSDPITTIIDGDDIDSVIVVSGSIKRNTVILDHLRLTNGRNNGINAGGGISAINADVDLRLNDIYIDDNTGSQGGGIAIFTGTTNITAHNLMLKDNTASSGGGIFCDGSGLPTILIDGDESNTYGITGNLANNGNGGGVYLSNGCTFSSYVGTDVNSNEDKRGIFANFATRNGGGLYVASESKAVLYGGTQCAQQQTGEVCYGNNSQPINVSYNVADIDESGDGFGAGVFVTGNNSHVEIYNGLINNNNTKLGNGGAVLISSDGRLTSDSVFSNGGCWNPGACNQFIENRASLGGAIQAESRGQVSINRTFFTKQLANAGNIVNADGVNTLIEMEGNLIIENGDFSGDFSNRNLFEMNNNSGLNLSFSTIADNFLTNTRPIILNQSSTVNVESSIVSEQSGILVYSSTSPNVESFNCLLVHESASLSGTSQFVTTSQIPGFIDRNNDNYKLDINLSPAIDYCNNPVQVLTDSDNDARGWDWTQISDFQGPYDLGYDENTDVIFNNGFEL